MARKGEKGKDLKEKSQQCSPKDEIRTMEQEPEPESWWRTKEQLDELLGSCCSSRRRKKFNLTNILMYQVQSEPKIYDLLTEQDQIGMSGHLRFALSCLVLPRPVLCCASCAVACLGL